MPIDVAPLAAFAFVTSITPGPNNLMLMASGARFGLRRTLPHMLGVSAGFGGLAVAVGFGLARVLEAAPALGVAMKTLCALFLFYLAWKIATSGAAGRASDAERPLSFRAAVAFQWINPKSWAMALTTMTLYAKADPAEAGVAPAAVFAATALFAAINLPCVCAWAAAGRRVAVTLADDGRRRLFNRAMALLLILSTAPIALADV